MQQIHVTTGLPRSGSELMQALLAQHPDIYASATSPLLEFMYGAYGNYALPEVKSQDPAAMEASFDGFCREALRGFCEGLTDRPIFVDKNRGWIEHLEWLWKLYPDAKAICMVRPVEAIVASLERIYQRHKGHPETRDLPATAEGRSEYWRTTGRIPLGLAMDRVRERQNQGEDQRIKYVNYDDLVDAPVQVMRDVFTHLGVEPVDIDPNNVQKSVPEDDSHFGIFGDHALRPVVSRG